MSIVSAHWTRRYCHWNSDAVPRDDPSGSPFNKRLLVTTPVHNSNATSIGLAAFAASRSWTTQRGEQTTIPRNTAWRTTGVRSQQFVFSYAFRDKRENGVAAAGRGSFRAFLLQNKRAECCSSDATSRRHCMFQSSYSAPGQLGQLSLSSFRCR